jgi:pimeloyl-ACP methyl ester carboxylesterase
MMSNPGAGNAILVSPFEVSFDRSRIEDLSERLRRTRWSPEVDNEDGRYGTTGRYMRELMDYWADAFDWDAQQRALNRFENFRAVVDGITVHFIHARGQGPNPIPLILTHGWPETFWDWHRVIGPLSDPAAYGGDPADAFDVIVPSLPGFAYSSPLEVTGVTPPVVARLWHRLMQDGLGYSRFGAAGGDWGSFTSSELAIQFPDDVLGIYLSYPPRFHVDVENLPDSDYDEMELDWRSRQTHHRATNLSHVPVQTHGPQTLAWGFNDSPAGLASWLLEPRIRWSDCNNDVESVYSRDYLVTTFSLYWMTETIGSSMRIYADTFGDGLKMHSSTPPARIEVPTGIGVYPQETSLIPRKACARVANLVLWSVHPRGGHFAAAEQPDLYVEDIRRLFRPLRPEESTARHMPTR